MGIFVAIFISIRHPAYVSSRSTLYTTSLIFTDTFHKNFNFSEFRSQPPGFRQNYSGEQPDYETTFEEIA